MLRRNAARARKMIGTMVPKLCKLGQFVAEEPVRQLLGPRDCTQPPIPFENAVQVRDDFNVGGSGHQPEHDVVETAIHIECRGK